MAEVLVSEATQRGESGAHKVGFGHFSRLSVLPPFQEVEFPLRETFLAQWGNGISIVAPH